MMTSQYTLPDLSTVLCFSSLLFTSHHREKIKQTTVEMGNGRKSRKPTFFFFSKIISGNREQELSDLYPKLQFYILCITEVMTIHQIFTSFFFFFIKTKGKYPNDCFDHLPSSFSHQNPLNK